MDIDFFKIELNYYKHSKKYFNTLISYKENQKLHKKFNIKENEFIITSIVRGNLIKTREVVMSNKAIYGGGNIYIELYRIGYEELCKYVAISDDSAYSCILKNDEGEIPLLNRSLGDIITKSTYGEELKLYIQAIQQYMMDNDASKIEERKKLVEWVVKEAEDKLNYGDISNLSLVKELQKEKICYTQMSIILGKILVKTCNYEEFVILVSSIVEGAETDILREIKSFIQKFEKDSKSGNIAFLPDYVKRTSQNIEKAKKMIGTDMTQTPIINDFINMLNGIELYFKIRNNPFITDSEVIQLYQITNVSDVSVADAIKFCNIQKNHLMASLVKKIKDKKTIDDNSYVNYIDAYGFTPLHYAIIIGNTDAISFFMKKFKKLKTVPAEAICEEILKMHDYSILAQYCGNNELSDTLFVKSPEMVALQKNIKSLKNQLAIRNAIYNANRKILSTADRKMREFDSQSINLANEEDIKERMEETGDGLISVEDEIRELKKEINNIQREIDNCWNSHCKEVNEWVERIEKSSDINTQFFKDKWNNLNTMDDYFYLTENDCVIKEFNNVYFFIPNFLYDQYKMNNLNNKENALEIAKPFKDNWFSPEAYASVDMLRIEYWKLEEVYHSDVNPIFEQAFIEIVQEKDKILEEIIKIEEVDSLEVEESDSLEMEESDF